MTCDILEVGVASVKHQDRWRGEGFAARKGSRGLTMAACNLYEFRWMFVDKNNMYFGVTLYCEYLIVLWLFHLVFVLYCD